MKRALPIHPIVFAAFPPVFLYARNVGMLALQELWRPLWAAVAFGALVYVVSGLLLRDVARGALAASGTIWLFFSFRVLESFFGPTLALTIQVLAAAALWVVIWRIGKRDLRGATKVANFFSVVLIAISLVQLAAHRSANPGQMFLPEAVKMTATAKSAGKKPDIFFVILDGYGRADQLRRVMGYDNSEFVSELEKRGFYVASGSHSTYCQTQLSLASTLNLSPIQDYPQTFPANGTDRANLTAAMDESLAASYLKGLGYRYLAVTTGFDSVKFDSADVVYSEPVPYTMLESALLANTPLPTVAPQVDSMFNQRRRLLQSAFRNLAHLGRSTAAPRFVVAHVLAPHPPFVFDRLGRPTRYKQIFGYWDGSHFMEVNGSPQTYRDGYSEQIQYINKMLLETVDSIVAQNPEAVIVLQGDHGSKLHLDQEFIEKTDLDECFSNLFALRASKNVTAQCYPSVTSVNTFRILFNGLFGEKLPLLPDRSYYSPFSSPYRFTDVTSRLQKRSSWNSTTKRGAPRNND